MGQLKQLPPLAAILGAASKPTTIEVPNPIVTIHAIIKMVITTAKLAGTVKSIQDGVKRFLRTITLLRAGESTMTWGRNSPEGSAGIMLENVNRNWLGSVPAKLDPDGVMGPAGSDIADGAHTVQFRLAIPVALPPFRYNKGRVNQSALRIANETWQLQCQFGTFLDVVALTADATAVIDVSKTEISLAVEIDRSLKSIWPQGIGPKASGLLLKTVPLADDLTSAANEGGQEFDISKVGDVLAHAIMVNDNGIGSDLLVSKITFIINDDIEPYRAEYPVGKAAAEFNGDNASETGLPAGMTFVDFDAAHDLTGRIQTAKAAGWKARVAHAGATGSAPFVQQVLYLQRFLARK